MNEATKQIVEFDEFETSLIEFKNKYEGVVYDLSDKKQDKKARSDKLTIGKVISALDLAHKTIKAPLLAKTKLLDSERKRIKDDLLGVQNGIKQQISNYENAIKEHAEMLQSKIDHIVNMAHFDVTERITIDLIQGRLNEVRDYVIDDSFEGRKGDAAIAKDEAICLLEYGLSGLVRDQEEKTKAEEERQAVVKVQLEKDAKEKADKEAAEAIGRAEQEKQREREAKEKAEQRAKDVEEQAKRDVAQAEAREKTAREDEANRIEYVRIANEKAKRKAKEKREADQENRQKVISEAVAGLVKFGINERVARLSVKAIANGSIPHIVLNF